MTTGQRFKSGDQATTDGQFIFGGYLDGSQQPAPKNDERSIPMKRGATFPRIASTNKPCYWDLKR